jgi:hypothetical protein
MKKRVAVPIFLLSIFILAIQCGGKNSDPAKEHERAAIIPAGWNGLNDYSKNYTIK